MYLLEILYWLESPFWLVFLKQWYKLTQPAFTCSKLTTVTLEQDVKYVQSLHTANGVSLVSVLLTLNMFQTLI